MVFCRNVVSWENTYNTVHKLEFFVRFMLVLLLLLLLSNMLVRVFHQHRNPFNFISNIFFSYFECGWHYKRNMSARLFEIKLNHEINWSWNIKNWFPLIFNSWFSTRQFVNISIGEAYENQKHIAISGIFPTSWKTFGEVRYTELSFVCFNCNIYPALSLLHF